MRRLVRHPLPGGRLAGRARRGRGGVLRGGGTVVGVHSGVAFFLVGLGDSVARAESGHGVVDAPLHRVQVVGRGERVRRAVHRHRAHLRESVCVCERERMCMSVCVYVFECVSHTHTHSHTLTHSHSLRCAR